MAAPRVVIVGAGFGGLRAARTLAGRAVDVEVLDRHNYHLFQPLLYQVATAGLSPDEIAYPVRAIFRRFANVRFRMDEVVGVDFDSRRVRTRTGARGYDYLILAVGARTTYYGLESVRRHGLALKDLNDAVAIRNHVLAALELAAITDDPGTRRRLLSFIIVGGGPTGVEMAGALAELTAVAVRKDYPDLSPQACRILLLEAADQLLPGMPGDLAGAARTALERKGVTVRLAARVTGYDGQEARIEGEPKPVPAATLIWSAGVEAAPLTRDLGMPTARQGRVPVEPTLQLPGRPEVFCVGDAAYGEQDGRPYPMMAPVALQMGETAARNVLRLVRGDTPEVFRYRDPGSLATIGRNQAVAHVRGWKFRGFVAWVVWLVVHLIQLIGFRNRLIVLINWAWDYFFYERAVRLITRE